MISFGCIDVGGMQFIFYELNENSPYGRKWEATLAKVDLWPRGRYDRGSLTTREWSPCILPAKSRSRFLF
jgi:hypothetical protein